MALRAGQTLAVAMDIMAKLAFQLMCSRSASLGELQNHSAERHDDGAGDAAFAGRLAEEEHADECREDHRGFAKGADGGDGCDRHRP